MSNLWLYTACRVVIGLGIPGLYNGIFTVFLENLDTRRRSHYYILVIQGWSSGVLFTALFGYLFPDFRHYEIAMAVATVPIVLGEQISFNLFCINPDDTLHFRSMGKPL